MTVQSPPLTALYCYGVTWADAAEPQRAGGLAGNSVEPVPFDELAALTSAAPAGKIRARRADLMCHFDVLARAFERGTVIPLRFGMVFDDVVEDFLRPRHDELVRLLRELDGRVELRVTAHYREEAILAEVVHENARIAGLRGASSQPMLIELGELVAGEVRARTDRDARAILNKLRPLALDQELDEEPIEHQVLRASFLVERKKVSAFDKAMEELASGQAGRIDFKYVGPLPPHSFVALEAR
jgi:hypothetical protein